eukprot:SAG22_NODE_373_length_11549_cov_12.592052_1_plen_341_part_00
MPPLLVAAPLAGLLLAHAPGPAAQPWWTTIHAADCIDANAEISAHTGTTPAKMQALCEQDAACVGFTMGTGVHMAVGSGSLKNATCIDHQFSSAAPTLYLEQTHPPGAVGWPPVWPHPASFRNGSGTSALRALRVEVNVSSADAVPANMEAQLRRFEDRLFGDGWPAAAEKGGQARLLQIQVGAPATQFDCDESYSLDVPASDAGPIVIVAATGAGVNWALESLSQLLVLDRDNAGGPRYAVANAPVHIEDAPRFGYRSFFIDSARHFLSLAVLRRVVAAISAAKFNTVRPSVRPSAKAAAAAAPSAAPSALSLSLLSLSSLSLFSLSLSFSRSLHLAVG